MLLEIALIFRKCVENISFIWSKQLFGSCQSFQLQYNLDTVSV